MFTVGVLSDCVLSLVSATVCLMCIRFCWASVSQSLCAGCLWQNVLKEKRKSMLMKCRKVDRVLTLMILRLAHTHLCRRMCLCVCVCTDPVQLLQN